MDWSPLFGYDFFISYKRGRGAGGSSEYATRLKSRLIQADFQCFLDDDDAPVGESLNPSIERGLRRSRAMIVLCSPEAFESKWVSEEIQTFARKKYGSFIPISFANFLDSLQLDENPLASLVAGESIWLSEDDGETPSDQAIGGIQARFNYRRANSLRTWFLSVVAITLVMVSLVAIIQSRIATQQRDEANKQRVEAERQRNVALARYLASEGLRAIHESHSVSGLVLLVESLRLEKTPEAEGGLFSVMTTDPHLSMQRFQLPAEGDALSFNGNGTQLAVGLSDGTAVVRDLSAGLGPLERDFEAGKNVHRLTGDGSSISGLTFNGAADRITGLTVGGKWLEWNFGSQPTPIRTRAIATGKREATTEYLALGGAGQLALVSDYLGPLSLFDARDGMRRDLDRKGCYGDPVALSEDGEVLACGDCTEVFRGVRLYKWRPWQPIGTLPMRFPNCSVSLALSKSGDVVAVGTERGEVVIWMPQLTKHTPIVLEHQSDVYGRGNAGLEVTLLRFSPNNKLLATRYRHAAYLWQVESGELLAKFPGGNPTAFAFSANSQSLAIANGDGEVRMWDLRVESWMDWACRNADRNLTAEEWQRYLPGVKYRNTCLPDQ